MKLLPFDCKFLLMCYKYFGKEQHFGKEQRKNIPFANIGKSYALLLTEFESKKDIEFSFSMPTIFCFLQKRKFESVKYRKIAVLHL